MFVEITVGIVIFYILIKLICQRRKDMPPGPQYLPFIGNLLRLILKAKSPFVAFDNISKSYGDIFSFRFGKKDLVILTSYESIRDIAEKIECQGCPYDKINNSVALEQQLVFTHDDHPGQLDLHRLLGSEITRPDSLQVILRNELHEVTSRIKQLMADGRATNMWLHTFFDLSFLNILWFLLTGERYPHDDPKLLKFKAKTVTVFKTAKILHPSMAFPFIRKLFPEYFEVSEQVAAESDFKEILKERISEHLLEELSAGSFLKNYQKEKQAKEDELVAVCSKFLLPGCERTCHTLEYAILYMMLNLTVQEKVYKEIVSVVGRHGYVSALEHLDKLPYTEATLMEIQRMSSILPLTSPHRTLRDISYRNHQIPAGTVILFNLYSVNMDKSKWGDPEIFRPERFLNADGSINRSKDFIPFGVGQRNCPGETLARMALILYFTTLMQNFRFVPVPGHLDPPTDPVIGACTLSPKPYNAVIQLRLHI